MDSVGIKELKRDASALLKKVREDKESIEVTYRGEVIAHIVPAESEEERRVRIDEVRAELHRLAQEVGKRSDGTISAVEAVREQRRDF